MVQTKGEKEKSRRRKLRVTVKNNIILDYMLDEKNYLNLFFFWGGFSSISQRNRSDEKEEVLFLVVEEYSYSSQVSNSLKHMPENRRVTEVGLKSQNIVESFKLTISP